LYCFVRERKKENKSLVPKRYNSILIDLSKKMFSLPRKWQDENHYFLFQTFTSMLKNPAKTSLSWSGWF